jgi:hypothetical protein
VATLTFDFPLERVGMVFSSDGRRMAVGNVLSLYQATAFDVPSGEIAAPSERFAFLDLEVWDLVEFRRLWQAKPARTARHSSLTFSADGRYLAAWVMFDLEQRLEVIDLEEGAAHQLPRHADTPGASAWNRATPPRLVFPHPPAKDTGDERGRLLFSKGAGGCRMFDVAERRLLWEFVHFSDCDVLAGTDVVLCQSAANASTETLDPWTGKHQFNLTAGFRIPAPGAFPHGVNLDAVARGRAGGHVAFQGVPAPDAPLPGWRAWLEKKWPKVFDSNRPQVLVVDAATGQERLRVTAPAVGLMLSDDAGTLLTLHGPVTWEAAGPATSIQVWDVPPYRAAAWGATTAALMAGALAAGALALFYRRRRQADAARAASGRDVPPVSAKPGCSEIQLRAITLPAPESAARDARGSGGV